LAKFDAKNLNEVKIDATTGALAWRWAPADTTVANEATVDVAEPGARRG